MRIGVDLDNTIVSYDGLFQRVAVREGLVPADCPPDKQAVRDLLRAAGREDDWTRLQGRIYGDAMTEALPFAGVADFFRMAEARGWELFIVSHRTRQPYLGPLADLHQAARDWLRHKGFTDGASGGLAAARVFLEESLEAKLQRIADLRLDVFIDDLPELLLHRDFPAQVERVCFDPANRCLDANLQCVAAWRELTDRWFGEEDA